MIKTKKERERVSLSFDIIKAASPKLEKNWDGDLFEFNLFYLFNKKLSLCIIILTVSSIDKSVVSKT